MVPSIARKVLNNMTDERLSSKKSVANKRSSFGSDPGRSTSTHMLDSLWASCLNVREYEEQDMDINNLTSGASFPQSTAANEATRVEPRNMF